MALTVSKIRLGAPTSFLLGVYDMGVTEGGVTVTYTPKDSPVMCDQYLSAVTVFRVEETATIEAGFLQTTMAGLSQAFGDYGNGDVVTVVGAPSTDTFYVGGRQNISTSTCDLTIPKNDGTANNILVHVNKIYAGKETKMNFQRDKPTTYKVTLDALADPTQVVGKQLFYMVEQY